MMAVVNNNDDDDDDVYRLQGLLSFSVALELPPVTVEQKQS